MGGCIFEVNSKGQGHTAWKVPKYGVISGPYFPVFRLNTEYSVSFRIQSEYRKILTRNNSVLGHFPRSGGNRHYVHLPFCWSWPEAWDILQKREGNKKTGYRVRNRRLRHFRTLKLEVEENFELVCFIFLIEKERLAFKSSIDLWFLICPAMVQNRGKYTH